MTGNINKPGKSPARMKKPPAPETLAAVAAPRSGNWRTWVNLVLLFLTLWVAVFSIEQVRWIDPQPSLTLVLFLSMLLVWLLVLVRTPAAVIHVLAPLIGVAVTAWQALKLLPETPSLNYLLNVLQAWWQGSGGLLPGEEKIVFAVFITFVAWIIGYVSTWFILRRHNAWVAVTLGTVAVIINLSNLPGKYFYFFPLFFAASVLLIIQTRIAGQYARSGHGTGFTARSLLYLVASLVCITVLAVSVAWITPQVRVPALQNVISTQMVWKRDIQESKINIFSAIPSKRATSTASTLKNLPFEDRWNQGDEVDFTVKADRPSYWPVNVYDTYTAEGWANSPTTEYMLEKKEPRIDTGTLGPPDVMNYQVTAGIYTDVLLVAGDFVYASSPVLVHEGAGDDVLSVTTPRVLGPGERYTVRSVYLEPSGDDLSRAGVSYPQSIKDIYLQLPPDLPDDIRRLSENITAGAATPYAKVLAIVEYLATFPYEQVIEVPPEGADGVEYFLFTQKSGFCTYFASAMAVMLRSAGVPARLAVGYLPGDPGEERGIYLLRDKHYHAWPQVYFPGYGWINFEATPGGAGSQVSIETPLVSTPAIKDSPQWDVWLYPPDAFENMQEMGLPTEPPESPGPGPGRLPYATKLGWALLILLCGVIGIGLFIGVFLVMRSVFYRRLWRVDREALAYTTYAKMCRLAGIVKLSPRLQQTPLEFAAELNAAFPQQADALDSIVGAYMENRFGRRKGKPDLSEEAMILKARHVVFDTLLQRAGRIRRMLFWR